MKIVLGDIAATVIEISKARYRRAGMQIFPGEECLHRHIEIDPMTKDTDCKDCNKVINLSVWMLENMNIWERMNLDIEMYQKAKQDYEQLREAYSLQQRVKCQHCNRFTRKSHERKADVQSIQKVK